MRNTPMLCLVLLKKKGWLAALCRLRDNPALSVCAFKGCMTASGCISVAKMVNKVCCIHREETRVCSGRVDSVRHCVLWSYTALGETEPGGKDARPAGHQSVRVSPSSLSSLLWWQEYLTTLQGDRSAHGLDR